MKEGETMTPQAREIYEYMKAHGAITQNEATKYIGCIRLPARIYDIKCEGYRVIKTMVPVRNRHGVMIRVASYRLGEGE